jgi:hypothetical protein
VNDETRLRKAITEIGEELVKCEERCAGVANDVRAGILPRCLILDRSEESGRGCIVVGINPGRSEQPGQSKSDERAFYRENGASYESVVAFWSKNVGRIQYYVKLRQFVDAVGLSGPIVWSDLAKCENAPGHKGLIPMQTLRTCVGRYLKRELLAIPPDWPAIGVGKEAYKALAYLEPDRTVIGIPHPTGSRGLFPSLFEAGKLCHHVASLVKSALKSESPIAVWVSANGEDA